MSEMQLHNLAGRSQKGYTTWGCLWDRGICDRDAVFYLESDAARKISMQSRITAWWPDGSVKWSAHTADAGKMGKAVHLGIGEERPAAVGQEEVSLAETEAGWKVSNGFYTFAIPNKGGHLLENVCVKKQKIIDWIGSKLILEQREPQTKSKVRKTEEFEGKLDQVKLVETGPIQLVVKYEGIHCQEDNAKIPFCIYMRIGAGEENFHFTYTFFYDGDEEKDFLKGLGLTTAVPMSGALYNRHIKCKADYGYFHESVVQLLGGKKFSWSVYEQQMQGVPLLDGMPDLEKVRGCMDFFPYWDRYELVQDSAEHFSIRKRIADENCCYLDCLSGRRTSGITAVGSEQGSLLFGIRDFWEKYPSGLTVEGLAGKQAQATLWLWAPGAEAMDFRHYANTGYSQIYYEGYPWKGATPYGIACTSELTIGYCLQMVPEDRYLDEWEHMVCKPPQYVGTPEYYHEKAAFGHWSLPKRETEVENWLEDQVDNAVKFYQKEVEQRKWYGLFNYGDIMHMYDPYRHVWRYDMGGFAWDNTELVPTYWFWYQFLRCGKEDVFTFAEKLTRHTSEVDAYHFGPYKGLGSRHNVRHWGCACKEIRIAMAGHHRFYYYLTGDYRLGDIFDNFAESEYALQKQDPLGSFYNKEEMVYPTHARSGPDWSSLCSDWMTSWERHQDRAAMQKIKIGIEDIKQAPLRLISGPDYEFSPETGHLRYIGERTTGGTHLQICMGAAQIWIELADLLLDEQWQEMLREYGEFYFLSHEQQQKRSNGLIGDREFTLPMLACGIGAYAAARGKDEKLAYKVWRQLFAEVYQHNGWKGYTAEIIENSGNQKKLEEIPWVTTNTISQWCLNVITSLEYIRAFLPEKMEHLKVQYQLSSR